jgi:hypothetical protein
MSSGVSRYLDWVEWGGRVAVYWGLWISMKDDCGERVDLRKSGGCGCRGSWGCGGRWAEGQRRGRDGGQMEVRGRWWKKAKDIIPNKKADGRFEVCGSARVGLCSSASSFPFSVTRY